MALGRKTGGGSRKGRPNKTTADVKEAIEHAFNALGGPSDLASWAKDNRDKFYTLMLTRLLPKDINTTVRRATDASRVSDDELADIATGGRSDIAEPPADKARLN